MAAYGAALLGVSLLISWYVPASAMSVVGNIFGEDSSRKLDDTFRQPVNAPRTGPGEQAGFQPR